MHAYIHTYMHACMHTYTYIRERAAPLRHQPGGSVCARTWSMIISCFVIIIVNMFAAAAATTTTTTTVTSY